MDAFQQKLILSIIRVSAVGKRSRTGALALLSQLRTCFGASDKQIAEILDRMGYSGELYADAVDAHVEIPSGSPALDLATWAGKHSVAEG